MNAFTSSSVGPTLEDNFLTDLTAGNLELTPFNNGVSVEEYQKNTNYKKDTLVYHGDRLGRVVADFLSDFSRLLVEDSFKADIDAGHIVVDDISIDELESQLLKAIPIVAFVSTTEVPRFQSRLKISGNIPTFRDGTFLDIDEKKGANFFYIMDSNGELTGLALITNYDETLDEFTVNAMKFGVGTTDNILPTHNRLTKRQVGDVQIINKDDLLDPVLIIKSSPPDDKTKPWVDSVSLDASDIAVGTVNVKIYNATTTTWDLSTLDVKDSEVVKNGNGSQWQYYRLYDDRDHVPISLSDWQLVYDTNQILGKIIDVDTTAHLVTIRTIHANQTGEPELVEDIQANVAIGAAPANFLYPQGMTFTEFVKKITLKDVLVSATFTASNSGLKKKGTTINSSILQLVITNLGNVSIQDIVFYKGNVELDTQVFNVGTLTYSFAYSDPITTNTTFRAVVRQDKGYVVEKSSTFTFVNPSYFGVVSSLNPSVSDIEALTEDVKNTKVKNYTHSINDARACYAYPAAFGSLSHIKDDNNFEYIDSFTKSTITMNGELYNVYVLTDPVTVSNFIWKFE